MNQFHGTWTALITPFQSDESVDYLALGQLIENQINGDITGILLLGTTAEAPTLTISEKKEIVDYSIKKINGRCQVMVNVGTNCTRESIENTKYYNGISGIDAYLVVNPYYNKPTQTGLYLHFKNIAESTERPIFTYNIQGRTGVNLETPTLLKLLDACKNIVGVKEASGNLQQIEEVIRQTAGRCVVLSGDDALTVKVLGKGGHGVISVASNFLPKEVNSMVEYGLAGKSDEMIKIHTILLPLFEGQFIQTNPLPIKTALSQKGIIKEVFRLPLCSMDHKEKSEWTALYENILAQTITL